MGLHRVKSNSTAMGKGMSKLQLLHRPWVVFDAHNDNHRRYYADFCKYATWGRCPVRFIMDDDSNDLITMIQRKLVEYYVLQEFPVLPKPKPKLDKYMVDSAPKNT